MANNSLAALCSSRNKDVLNFDNNNSNRWLIQRLKRLQTSADTTAAAAAVAVTPSSNYCGDSCDTRAHHASASVGAICDTWNRNIFVFTLGWLSTCLLLTWIYPASSAIFFSFFSFFSLFSFLSCFIGLLSVIIVSIVRFLFLYLSYYPYRRFSHLAAGGLYLNFYPMRFFIRCAGRRLVLGTCMHTCGSH
jgi:hypothetical protein